MRVSTGMIFDGGTAGILRNQSDLFKTQNQLSTGRRVLTPADDPVASAQVLISTQSRRVNSLYAENQKDAGDQLKMLEGNLDGVTNLIHDIRERAVQLGNGTLTQNERGFIASEFKARFEDLMGLANQQNGAGQYLFSGYQGSTKPFAVDASPNVAPFNAANPIVQYFGDQGERLLQVEASRQMSVTASGQQTFLQVRNGNGTFAVSTPTAAPRNVGTAIADQGNVLDMAKWTATPPSMQPQDFDIRFMVDEFVIPPKTYYTLVDNTSGASMMAGMSGAAPSPWATTVDQITGAKTVMQHQGLANADWVEFVPGQAVEFKNLDLSYAPGGSVGADLGFKVTIDGQPGMQPDPANPGSLVGDRFSVKTAQNQSIFDTFQNLIALAETPVPATVSGNTEFMNQLAAQVSALDQSLENVLKVRASVGARLSEVDSLQVINSDLDLQYAERISNLQDLDYAKAITDLQRQQMQLQAAQQSFSRISSLSLFDHM